MSTTNFLQPTIVWKPTESTGQKMREFWKYISEKYNVKLENYWDLHRWSIENLEDFWEEIWQMTGIISSKPYEKVLDTSVSLSDGPEWFIGARLNYAENILKRRDDRVAIIAAGEDRETRKYTFAEIYQEACRYGAALRKIGVKKGDRVVCYMSNREEAIFAMLGATAAGAIFSGALPLIGAKAVLSRFKLVKPKFLFTIDRFAHDREEKEMLSKVKEIVDDLPSLEKVIIVPSKPESRFKEISQIRNSCFLDDFLSFGVNTDGSIPDLVFEQLPFSHPVYINYTSGTTGNPKALVHGAGCILSLARDCYLQLAEGEENCWLSVSPAGWVSWNMFATLLVVGMRVVVYEGVPYYLYPTSLWDLVDEFQVSHLFFAVSTLDEMEKKEYLPGKKNHLSSVTTAFAAGSVVKPQNYDFVYKKIKSDILFGSAFGCTEVLGAVMVIDQTLPVYRGEIAAPALGLNACCYNDEGKSILGEMGELVITTPSPSLPLFIWGDKEQKLYKELYFAKYKDAFSFGDLIIINPVTKGIIVIGRSDDTLKQRGWRFGSSEIYNAVDTVPEVMDTLCVGQYNKHRDERAVLFVKMKDGHQFTEEIERRIRNVIERELTKNHVPDVIVETEDVPKNMTGKKMEIIVKKIINKLPYNTDNVFNPECLPYFERFAEVYKY